MKLVDWSIGRSFCFPFLVSCVLFSIFFVDLSLPGLSTAAPEVAGLNALGPPLTALQTKIAVRPAGQGDGLPF